jgi:sugar-specific transcriptional regulator TrmB
MNEKLDKLRCLLNELNEMKQPYIIQRDQAENMIEKINWRIDEVQEKIEMAIKGEEVAV